MFRPGKVIDFDPRNIQSEFEKGLALSINLAPSLTLARGTILGQYTAAVNHVFTITVTDTVSGGTFTITAEDPLSGISATTATLAHNVSNADLEDALEGIYGAGNVVVAGTALPTGPVTITLQEALAGFPAPTPTIAGAALTGGGSYGIAASAVGRSVGSFDAYSTLKLAAPAAAVSASGTGSGGGFAAGSYLVQHTYSTAEGETTAGPATSVALTVGQQLRIAQITGLDARITAVNVYANGAHVGSITPSGGTAAQTDFTQAGGTAGRRIPAVNTTGNPRAVLPRDLATSAAGLITLGAQAGGYLNEQGDPSTPAFFGGVFQTTDLTGLDADAVAILGRIIKGTQSDGLLAVLC